jgi:hypothetical protein
VNFIRQIPEKKKNICESYLIKKLLFFTNFLQKNDLLRKEFSDEKYFYFFMKNFMILFNTV